MSPSPSFGLPLPLSCWPLHRVLLLDEVQILPRVCPLHFLSACKLLLSAHTCAFFPLRFCSPTEYGAASQVYVGVGFYLCMGACAFAVGSCAAYFLDHLQYCWNWVSLRFLLSPHAPAAPPLPLPWPFIDPRTHSPVASLDCFLCGVLLAWLQKGVPHLGIPCAESSTG